MFIIPIIIIKKFSFLPVSYSYTILIVTISSNLFKDLLLFYLQTFHQALPFPSTYYFYETYHTYFFIVFIKHLLLIPSSFLIKHLSSTSHHYYQDLPILSFNTLILIKQLPFQPFNQSYYPNLYLNKLLPILSCTYHSYFTL